MESSASGNLWGFFADGGGSILAIADSTADDNSGGGVGATEFARVSLTRMVLSSNNGGVRTFGSSPTISVGGSLIASNSAGLWNQGGTIETFQDNQLRANTFNSEGRSRR